MASAGTFRVPSDRVYIYLSICISTEYMAAHLCLLQTLLSIRDKSAGGTTPVCPHGLVRRCRRSCTVAGVLVHERTISMSLLRTEEGIIRNVRHRDMATHI
jgi:hypothetical protein